MRKGIIAVVILLVLASAAIAEEVNIGELEKVIMTKLEKNKNEINEQIDAKAQNCRENMRGWSENYIEEKTGDIKNYMWKDRVLTAALVFLAIFVAGMARSLMEHRLRLKLVEAERLTGNKPDFSIIKKYSILNKKMYKYPVYIIRKDTLEQIEKREKHGN